MFTLITTFKTFWECLFKKESYLSNWIFSHLRQQERKCWHIWLHLLSSNPSHGNVNIVNITSWINESISFNTCTTLTQLESVKWNNYALCIYFLEYSRLLYTVVKVNSICEVDKRTDKNQQQNISENVTWHE